MGLLVGIALSEAQRFLKACGAPTAWALVTLVFLGVCVQVSYGERKFLFPTREIKEGPLFFGGNHGPEIIEVANYIKTNSTPDQRIAVLGSEPAIFFYSQRRSATGYIYTYPLMETHKYASEMQREMIREIEAARPEFLVMTRCPLSWLATPQSDRTILLWFDKYAADNYDLVGVTEQTDYAYVYYWGDQARKYSPTSERVMLVFKKKPGK
jgi:hypothetical protein